MRSPGDSVARYTLHSLLGRGGMGEVYEAEDKVLERRVALKLPVGEISHGPAVAYSSPSNNAVER